MLAVQRTSNSFFSDSVKTAFGASLLTGAVVAAFFVGGGILNHFHKLPSGLAWTNLGTRHSAYAAIAMVTCGPAGIFMLHKKKSDPVITGSIFVVNPEESCALGKHPEHCLFFSPKTAEIERTDGTPWKDNPNEVLVKCCVCDFNVDSGENLLKNYDVFFLPFSLFAENHDYQRIKTTGNFVEFFYKKMRYKLKITQQSFQETFVPRIEEGYKANLGNPHPITNPTANADRASYECPFQTNRLTQQQKDWIEWKQHLDQFDLDQELINCRIFSNGLALDLPGVDINKITYFKRDTLFILVDQSRDYLRLYPFPLDEKLTISMIEKAISKNRYQDGVLFFLLEKNTDATNSSV